MVAEIELVSGSFNVLMIGTNQNVLNVATSANYTANTEVSYQGAYSGALVTPNIDLKATVSYFQTRVYFRGNGTFRFRKAALIKPP